MTTIVIPYQPGFSARFDAVQGAWGIQDSAPGAADGCWISNERYELFTQAHRVSKTLQYRYPAGPERKP